MYSQLAIIQNQVGTYNNINLRKNTIIASKMIDAEFGTYFNFKDINITVNYSTNKPYYEIVDKKNVSEDLSLVIKYLLTKKEDKAILGITSLNVILPTENGDLKVFASSDNSSIGKNPKNTNMCIYCMQEDFVYYADIPNTHQTFVISPIHFGGPGGWVVGAYEITFDFEENSILLEKVYVFLAFSSFVIFLISVILIIVIIRKFLIRPILALADGTKLIGKGELETKVNIKSRDEIGQLAIDFNQMAIDLKESRDKLHEYNRILEDLLKQKDEFIGQLGHDLKNPLQPLVGLLPMLIEKEKDPHTKEILEVMNKNAEYMQELIFKTLQLAKLRSSNIKFDFENTNLFEEVENVIKSENILLKENNFIVENKVSKDLFIQADKLRLVEVFKNLISNAIKYKSGDKGKIVIDAQREDEWATVSISDEGIGMSEDQLEKVFDEFYKADRFSSEQRSSGLGLSICKKIVEKHGGKIWVDSKGLGKGTTFYFKLRVSGRVDI